ncbi:MAG TPA: FAD binding domain-containing protein [Syntrophorhabdaceae bacterium]|nr:FAD binding domain-containing protein [Syntrophorhabdaceae bacterium]HNT69838.1 FAD binding domain-containing protein [Syntrophorhabdaceae bacterium]
MRPGYFEDLESFVELSSVKFEYLEPNSLKEACSMLDQHKEKAKLIAGGTQLIPLMKQRTVNPEYLVNLKNIPNLEYVDYYSDFAEEGVKIGAVATLFDLSRSVIINERASVLVDAINQRELGMNKTRWAYYMATIGGYLFTPESVVDVAPALMILDAKAVMQGIQGWETVPIESLFAKNGNEEVYEILGEIRIPKQQESEVGLVYEKSIGTNGAPSIGVAVYLRLDLKHVNIEEIRIVVGGIGAAPVEAQEGPAIMKDNPIDDHLIIDAADIAAGEVCKDSDPEILDRAREVIEEAIRHAIDRSIGDFALGY